MIKGRACRKRGARRLSARPGLYDQEQTRDLTEEVQALRRRNAELLEVIRLCADVLETVEQP